MEDGQVEERRKRHSAERTQSGVRILAVDDDRSYLRYLQFVLQRAGFDVVVADDGAAALELLHADSSIGLLIVDLAMPLMDGIETVRRVHADEPQASIYAMLLTAHDEVDTKLRALDSGLDDFLPKTASESEIVAKVRSAIRRIEMERRLHVQCEQLEALALTDELTGIANRRALFRAGDAILAAGRKLGVVMFDLDRFKQVNDTHGHLAGDRILADVAACLKENTRVGDLISRYGGDEFVLLLPDTEEEEARRLAGRIGSRVAALQWLWQNAPITITATFGVACGQTPATLPRLLTACDAGLYRRKALPRRPSATV